jgi:transcriptional regulator with XRE-family HTH domain
MNHPIIEFMEFKEYINNEYIKWRGNSRLTISDFARHLGVKQPTLDAWLNRGAVPNYKMAEKISSKLPDVYSILGLPSPESRAAFALLSPDEQIRFASAISEASKRASESGIDLSSPAGVEILKETFAKFGL